jgi:hypothetical protein
MQGTGAVHAHCTALVRLVWCQTRLAALRQDNFYTLTVYEKGAEVVRLYHTLLGVEGFRHAHNGKSGAMPLHCMLCPPQAHLLHVCFAGCLL